MRPATSGYPGSILTNPGVPQADAPSKTRTSSAPRGVHFGQVHSAESAPHPPPDSIPLAEHAARELEQCAPTLSASQAAALDEVVREVTALARSVVTQLTRGMQQVELGQSHPIGAYHLGVMRPNDEIDLLFVAPLHVQLMEVVMGVNSELQKASHVSSICSAGPDGALCAPGFRFLIRGHPVKLLLSQDVRGLPEPSGDVGVVQNVAGMYALQACTAILESVPNVATFQQLLRFVRFWAKSRGVYGSFLGFFSGTAWAICAARVCQMHPELELAQLASRFFRSLSRWDWRQPVAILPAEPDASSASAAAPSGDVASMASGSGILVRLPVGANLSATPMVTETTAKITQKELLQGYKLATQAEQARMHWADVYVTARFFQRHRHYLEFDFLATSKDVLAKWTSWGAQHLQSLAALFESTVGSKVVLRPWPEWIDYRDAKWPHTCAVFVGLHLESSKDSKSEGSKRSFDLREPTVKFLEAISAWPDADKHVDQFELFIRHVKLAELQQWLEIRQQGLVVHSEPNNIPLPADAAPGVSAPPTWTLKQAQDESSGKQCSL
mmetsp:Transcript_73530/g.137393  ORF Transcript_73530/g.137393 Transcript_73530/m.137393 type:complete len:557 (-) Transcript_73530:62-1732(-)